MDTLFLGLIIISGVCWMIVYLMSIYIGFKDKSYAMPFFALALNLCWEALYAYVYLTHPIGEKLSWIRPQGYISLLWFLFDVAILYAFLKYGKKEFSTFSTEKYFYPHVILGLVMAFASQYMFYYHFELDGPLYSAFVQNLIMSIAFIYMLENRKTRRGQSLIIAYAKFIGTACATVYCGILQPYPFALVLGIFCAIYDIIYILRLDKTPIYQNSLQKA